ncbi:MAG: hypothetical protein KGN84_09765 [Acidobacteriota bacterium]|nr:hypothetical protein [Acidobacteriota bacterium]
MNGTRHGLTGQVLIETDDDYDAHVEFVGRYVMELKPEGFIEIDLAHAIAEAAWRRNRIRAHENNYISLRLGTAPTYADPDRAQVSAAFIQAKTVVEQSRDMANLALYEQRVTNLFAKNMKALQELRKARLLAAAKPAPGPLPQPKAAGASTTSPEIGFVFSTAEAVPTPESIVPAELLKNAS